jgi:hypothetical protein
MEKTEKGKKKLGEKRNLQDQHLNLFINHPWQSIPLVDPPSTPLRLSWQVECTHAHTTSCEDGGGRIEVITRLEVFILTAVVGFGRHTTGWFHCRVSGGRLHHHHHQASDQRQLSAVRRSSNKKKKKMERRS